MASYPTITYSNVKHKVDNGLSSGVIQTVDEDITAYIRYLRTIPTQLKSFKLSAVAPFNQITGTLTSDKNLTRWEVRAILYSAANPSNYGPGVGDLLCSKTNIIANTATNFEIIITPSTFSQGDGIYRVCLMGQSEVDYSWDCTQIFAVKSGSSYSWFKYKQTGDYYEVHNNDIISGS